MLELLLDLTRRALEGFAFAAPCVGIWFLGLRFHKKAPPFAHMLAAFGLCLYLSGVLAVTGIGKPFGYFPRISLVPFVDMIKGPGDTTLNVLLFVPLGVLLPMLHPAFRTGGRVACGAFCLSLASELTQMFGLGITDINDLMTNTAGACLGFLILRRFSGQRAETEKKKPQSQSVRAWLEAFVIAASVFLSVMVFAPAFLR